MKNVKKQIAFLLAAVLLAVFTAGGNLFDPLPAAVAASFKLGDVDNDGSLTASDARFALRAAVGLEDFNAEQTRRADIDESGVVTAQDARLILRLAVGLETGPDSTFTVYVDASKGSDRWNQGSKGKPYATIQAAIDSGAENIIVEPGLYLEQISASDRNDLRIVLNTSEAAKGSEISRAVICPCDEIKGFSADDRNAGVFVLKNYKAEPDSRIEHTYAHSTKWDRDDFYDSIFYEMDSGGLQGGGGAYRCEVYESTGDLETSKTLRPAKTMDTCINNECSMFYDRENELLYIHPSDGTTAGKTFYIPFGSFSAIASFTNINNLVLNGLTAEFGNSNGIYFENVNNADVVDCTVAFVGFSSGFQVKDSNVHFHNCTAYQAAADGFGISGGGSVDLFNCKSTYNRDDGVSHHNLARGVVVGGDFSNNAKAGIALTYGASVNVYSATCDHNRYGLYYAGVNNTENHCSVFSCVCTDNSLYDVYVAYYYLFVKDCVYDTSKTSTEGQIVDLIKSP